MNGYGGSIVRVDLTTGSVSWEPTDPEEARAFLGGRGLNMKRLWDEVPAHLDGLAPENKVIFGVGPLVGSLFPGGSRFNVSGMSPQTGILGDSNAGGFFGPELKFAGFDQLIVEGRADRPVFLSVCRRPRGDPRRRRYLGIGRDRGHRGHPRRLGDRDVQAAVIGPAAENGVRFAGVFPTSYARPPARAWDAVMASKNLKAVAVRGTGMVPVFDMARFRQSSRWSMSASTPMTSTRSVSVWAPRSWSRP